MRSSRIRTWVVVVLAFVLTSGGDILTNYLANVLSGRTRLVLALVFGLAAMGFVYIILRRRMVTFELKTPIPLPDDAYTSPTYAHRGLILPVSLYQPQGSNPMAQKGKEAEILRAAKDGNYAALDFPNSNFANAITAMKAHSTCLEHVWLIATAPADERFPGSELYLDALCRYMKEVEHLTATIHCGPGYLIPLKSDVAITQMAGNLVDNIYREAKSKAIGLRDEDIVADVTGTTRSLQIGVILACLDRRRKVQCIGSQYGPDGKPVKGVQIPILYEFAPILAEQP